VIIVGTDEAAVEADLVEGRLSCPNCGSSLRPWGHGIERDVRLVEETERRRFRRSICRSCTDWRRYAGLRVQS
jgi:RNase P subunit RPR2